MDTITHGIAGALIGKAFFAGEPDAAPEKAIAGRVAIVATTLGSIFPDSDVFTGIFTRNDLAIIETHRAWTHSFVMLPFFALVFGALTWWIARRRGWPSPKWWVLAGIYAAGIALHILFDLITNFGTMIWSPLKNTRAAWDLVFIIDFTLTAIVLVPQLAAWAHRGVRPWPRRLALWVLLSALAGAAVWAERLAGFPPPEWTLPSATVLFAALFLLPVWSIERRTWCRAGVLGLAAYLVICAGAHHLALRRVLEFAHGRELRIEQLGAMPLPPSAAHWNGLVRTPDGVFVSRFDITRDAPVTYDFAADSAPNPYFEKARELPHVAEYLWFARFPVFKLRTEGGRNIVEISDLRFFRAGRRGRSGFTYRVTFDSDGHVVREGFARPD